MPVGWNEGAVAFKLMLPFVCVPLLTAEGAMLFLRSGGLWWAWGCSGGRRLVVGEGELEDKMEKAQAECESRKRSGEGSYTVFFLKIRRPIVSSSCL